MKKILKHVLLLTLFFISVGARSQIPTSTQQSCNLLIATVASTSIWRDNKVPIAKAQSNVMDVLNQMPATEEDKKQWSKSVIAIYSSTVSAAQIEETLRPQCAAKR